MLGNALLIIAALSCALYLFLIFKERSKHSIGILAMLVSLLSSFIAFFSIFASRDVSFEVVWMHVSTDLPPYLALSAIWAGQEGSLFVWTVALAVVIALEHRRSFSFPKGADARAFRYSNAFGAILLLLFVISLISSDPFRDTPSESLKALPDGQGMSPTLQNIWMIAHPPILIAGYACALAPFTNAFGAAIARCQMPLSSRMYMRASWLLLSIGILTGAIWAYGTLGWGGFWSWDPVEVASLLPWLGATGALHALARAKRHPLLSSALSMAVLPLSVFATIVTRSGTWFSVHAWGGSGIAAMFISIFAVSIFGAACALFVKGSNSKPVEDSLERSKMSAFIAVLFMAMFVVFVGLGVSSAAEPAFYFGRLGVVASFLFVSMAVCSLGRYSGKVASVRIFVVSFACSILAFVIGLALEIGDKVLIENPRVTYGAMVLFILPTAALSLGAATFGLARALAGNEGKAHKKGGNDQTTRSIGNRRYIFALKAQKAMPHFVHIGIVLLILGYSLNVSFSSESSERTLGRGQACSGVKNEGVNSFFSNDGRELVRIANFKVDGMHAEGKLHIFADQPWNSEPAIISTPSKDYYVSILERNETIKVFPTRDDTLLVAHPDAGRVLEMDLEGNPIWEYGDNGELLYPVSATKTCDGHYVIADQRAGKVIEVNYERKVSWEYLANHPVYAERIEEGKYAPYDDSNAYLIVESYVSPDALSMVNRVFEVNASKEEQWQYGGSSVEDLSKLFLPSMATKLPNRNTLIADTYHHQVIEIDPSNQVVLRLGRLGEPGETGLLSFPSYAQRLSSGNTLVTDFGNHRIVEFTHDGKIARAFGGNGTDTDGMLWAPTTAFFNGGAFFVADIGMHCVLKLEGTSREIIYDSQLVTVVVKEMPYLALVWSGAGMLVVGLGVRIAAEFFSRAHKRR